MLTSLKMHMNQGWVLGSVLSARAHAAGHTGALSASIQSPASPPASKGVPLICVKSLHLHQALDRLKSWIGVLEMCYRKEGLHLSSCVCVEEAESYLFEDRRK